MDIRANAEERRTAYERQIYELSYELKRIEERKAEIETTVAELRGGVGEIANLLRELDTQAAIEAAQNDDEFSAVMMTAEETTNA